MGAKPRPTPNAFTALTEAEQYIVGLLVGKAVRAGASPADLARTVRAVARQVLEHSAASKSQ